MPAFGRRNPALSREHLGTGVHHDVLLLQEDPTCRNGCSMQAASHLVPSRRISSRASRLVAQTGPRRCDATRLRNRPHSPALFPFPASLHSLSFLPSRNVPPFLLDLRSW